MEVYSNDDQRDQIETVKHFFSNNGKALAVGAVMGIAVLVGWRVWASHQQTTALDASARYQTLTNAMRAEDPASLQAVAEFINQNQNSYGALAALDLSKAYVDQHKLDAAIQPLQQGLKDSSDDNIQAVLNLRLARLQLEQKQPDAALNALDQIKGQSWQAMVADVRGAALLAKGDTKGARDAWNQGINSDASSALKQVLQMKINNLS